jgi:hypothetical protein
MRFIQDLLEAARQDVINTTDFIPNSLANEQYIRIVNEIPLGAKAYEFSTYTQFGQAAVIATQTTGVPTTNRTVSTRLVKIFPIRLGFIVTDDDIETGDALGTNIVSENMLDVRQGLEQKLDIVSYSGEIGTTLVGLANVPNVTRIDFPADGTGSSVAWSTKTPAQILRDLNLIALQVPTQTALTKSVNRLCLPASKLLTLQSTPYNTTAGNGDSILTVFLRNQQLVGNQQGITEVIGHPVLETLGTGGVGLIFVYNTNSPNNRLHIPQGGDFRDSEYSRIGTTWTVPCQIKTAGIEVKKTLEVAYANVA